MPFHECRSQRVLALAALIIGWSLGGNSALAQTDSTGEAAATPTDSQPAAATARRITPEELDGLVAREVPSVSAPASLDERALLVRVSFDLVGRQPTVAEQEQFVADSSPTKYRDLVERLLASPEFGTNWANYWSDTIAYRVPPPELTYLDYRPLKGWLAEKLNAGTPWDDVVRELITAKGKVAENPAATFVGYHQANPTNLAAETSRIFLGQHILCAQCHDHPFDHWKRTEFHALAAFFARTKAKLPWNDGPGTVVSALAKGEHLMPDMDDPTKPGSKMKPAFLIHDAADQRIGKDDAERRTRLAEWVTSLENPWFAKAYTNRIWARLMGRGFYEPVDELGDSAQPLWPAVHDAVSAHFAATHYDVKDLFRLITGSQAYLRGVQTTSGESAAGGASLARLRGDEVFTALVVGIELPNVTPSAVAPTNEVRFPPPPASTQDLVNGAFGADPSLTANDTPRTMAQALWMMNNEQLQKQLSAAPGCGTMLAKLLDEVADDQAACEKLYARVLARRPTTEEVGIAKAHVAAVGERRAAFEDLLWGIVNSAEFTARR